MEQRPLCVDLDGTLVYTNTLFEGAASAFKYNPFIFFHILLALPKGKAAVKDAIGRYANLDVATLPYNKELVEWLQGQYNTRKLILATASDKRIADAVASHLGIFDSVIANTLDTPVSAHGKHTLLCTQFGDKGFAYAGNSRADIAVWKCASSAILVNTSEDIAQQVRAITPVEHEFTPKAPPSLTTWLKTIRIHQWIKNLLLFTSPIAAHRLLEMDIFFQSTLAFFSFSFLASSVYIMNDLVDLPSDRAHATKQLRPLAAGRIQISHALLLGICLAIVSILVAVLYLPREFLWILIAYGIVTTLYSLRLKKIPYLDILILSGLYVLRIIAGGKATDIPTSLWLFVFAACIFISLGIAKRVTELTQLKETIVVGRGYTRKDLRVLIPLGISCGVFACILLLFYTQSATVVRLYTSPPILLLIVPIVALWLARMWKYAISGSLHEDPALFAAKDSVSYGTVILLLAILALAL